jgi:outer membrane protein assembly factor BamD
MPILPSLRVARRVLLLLVLALAMAGCKTFGKRGNELETLPVEALYQRGVTAIDAGNYGQATEVFSRLIGRFPFGAYSEQSQINLAYAQYKNYKNDDAYSTINRFIRTYPTHKNIDYAYYLRGLINFDRQTDFLSRMVGLDTTRRDQAFLNQSFEDLSELIKRYPQSRYAPDGRQRLIYLRDSMAKSEINIALFYLRKGAYVAAANRAKYVVETYPQTVQVGDGLAIMVDSYRALGQTQLADDAERVLKLNYPEHASFAGKWPNYHSNWWKLLPVINRG